VDIYPPPHKHFILLGLWYCWGTKAQLGGTGVQPVPMSPSEQLLIVSFLCQQIASQLVWRAAGISARLERIRWFSGPCVQQTIRGILYRPRRQASDVLSLPFLSTGYRSFIY